MSDAFIHKSKMVPVWKRKPIIQKEYEVYLTRNSTYWNKLHDLMPQAEHEMSIHVVLLGTLILK
jgi:hypothetical protein